MTSSSSSSSSSFTNLLSSGINKDMDNISWGLFDNGIDRFDIEIPKFKSFPPSTLPLSPPPVSPSTYLAIPPGLSPTELLDSPVLFSTSTVLPSPTTGAFAGQTFDWRSSSSHNQHGVRGEEKIFSDFSFQTQTQRPSTSSPPSTFFQSSSSLV